MSRDKKILQKLRREDPEGYAEMCVELGYKAEALKYYGKSRDTDEILKGAELAIDLKKYTLARTLMQRAEDYANECMDRAAQGARQVSMDPEGRGLMGAAYGYWGAEATQSKVVGKIQTLEARIRRKK